MALLKKTQSSKSSNNVIELNLNQRIKPFEDFDLDLDHQHDRMLSSEEVMLVQEQSTKENTFLRSPN